MSRNWVGRIVMGLVVLIILVGVGALAFQAGVNVGVVQQFPAGMPMMNPDGQAMGPWMMYGGPRMGWGGPGFGLLGFAFQVLLLVGFVALIGRLFFRGGWGGWRGGGPGGFEARARERFDQWHKEAHAGEAPTQSAS